MRGPSVYAFSWMHGCLLQPLVVVMFVISMLLAGALPEPYEIPGRILAAIVLLVFAWRTYSLVRCPRCGTSPLVKRSRVIPFKLNAMPKRHCRECALDLTAQPMFGPPQITDAK